MGYYQRMIELHDQLGITTLKNESNMLELLISCYRPNDTQHLKGTTTTSDQNVNCAELNMMLTLERNYVLTIRH